MNLGEWTINGVRLGDDDLVIENKPPYDPQAAISEAKAAGLDSVVIPEQRRPPEERTVRLVSSQSAKAKARAEHQALIEEIQAQHRRETFVKGATWRLAALGVCVTGLWYGMDRLLHLVAR